MEKIIIASDPLGFELKETVKAHLISRGYPVEDASASEPLNYYDAGESVGKGISSGKYDRGFLFCGTGMGVNIVANKFPGVYCGLCESVLTAKLCRIINKCNVLSMGGLIVSKYEGTLMADAFMEAEFSKGFSEAAPEFLCDAFKKVQNIEDKVFTDKSFMKN